MDKLQLRRGTFANLPSLDDGEPGWCEDIKRLYVGQDGTSHPVDTANVLDYGAKGDGVADDTEAIQAALTAKKNVYLPAGTYVVSTAMTWTADYGCSITGDRGHTIFIASEDVVMLSPPGIDTGQYCTIKGITFKSDTPGTATGIGTTVSGGVIAHCLITECSFENSLRYGIDGVLIENDILINQFGYPTLSAETTFKAIRSLGDHVAGTPSNENRIRSNEIIRCTDDYAIDIRGGYLVNLEENTFEQNLTTTGVIYLKDTNVNNILRNWMEANGAVPSITLEDGATLIPLLNVIDGNLIDVADQGTDCIIDITNLSVKRLVMENNLFAQQTHIIKSGASYDDLSWVIRWNNNFVTGAANPYTPNSTNSDWGYSGSGVIGGGLSVVGTASLAVANTTRSATAPTDDSTPVAILSSGLDTVYLVAAWITGGGSDFYATAMVFNDYNTGTAGLLNYAHGANMAITLVDAGATANVMLTHTAGSSQEIQYSILRLS